LELRDGFRATGNRYDGMTHEISTAITMSVECVEFVSDLQKAGVVEAWWRPDLVRQRIGYPCDRDLLHFWKRDDPHGPDEDHDHRYGLCPLNSLLFMQC